jgi:FKBP-type peptidyl-prolyl cis-trans isomerase FkpA
MERRSCIIPRPRARLDALREHNRSLGTHVMKYLALPISLMLTLAACHRGSAADAGAPAALRTDTDRTLYALGLVMGDRLGDFNLSPDELAVVERGIGDKVAGRHPLVEIQEWGPRISQMSRQRQTARAQVERQRGAAFAEQAAREPGAERLPSGAVYREMRAGTGPQPAPTDRVRVNYRGTLMDGTEFDSSYSRHQPAEFSLNGVIPCWTQGVGRMHVGGQARLVCPADTAYGDRGQRGIPPGSTLIFQVELLDILGSPAPPPAMPMLSLPPHDP